VGVSEQKVLARIETLRSTFDRPLCTAEARVQDQSIQLIFHPHTLAELCYLRRRLKPEDPVDAFLLGVTLGIMHGNERKDGNSAYASISMPNTFSMSPDYVRRFVQQKRLQQTYRNVFDLLVIKISKLFAMPAPQRFVGKVTTADAKRMADDKVIGPYRGQIALTLASPPYLDVVNYAKQNWIRMWLLGCDPVEVQEILDDNLNISSWLRFMQAVLAELQQLMRPDGVIILVIGDVARSRNSIVVPARELVRQLKHDGSFGYIGCISDRMNTTEKVTRIWTETKGQATAIDRILVLSQETPKIRDLSATPEIPWNIGPLNADDLAHHANYFSTSGL
jgi:site-specific DNA-methyltransferase (adenine-specific)